jgi:hypothetical protein
MSSDIHYLETPYGFEYGSVRVERTCSDDKKGWVVLNVVSQKKNLQVYVTKTGKMRLSLDGKEIQL